MDFINRLMVFVSMSLLLVYPSIVLYHTQDWNQNISFVMYSVMLLGLTLGNGLLSLYRPLKSTWLYFLVEIITILIVFPNYDVTDLKLGINQTAIFALELVFCSLGFLVSLLCLIYYLKKKTKWEMNEYTNNDTFYDFLGGVVKNAEIEQQLEKEMNGPLDKFSRKFFHVKFSRFTRIFSAIFTCITSIVYLIITTHSISFQKNQLAMIILLILILTPICLIMSIIYPMDFKYMYYFNVLFLLFCAIMLSSQHQINSFFFILTIILTGISFLITLIVDGRTWMGANPDE